MITISVSHVYTKFKVLRNLLPKNFIKYSMTFVELIPVEIPKST